MSKYTTEVRYICESLAGLDVSKGADSVDDVILLAYPKIFTTKAKLFDESYAEILYPKILKHYYLREIGAETVGIWKLWMNTRIEEILPYYNQLYKSALLNFDPLEDVNLTRTHTREEENNETNDNTRGLISDGDTSVNQNGTSNNNNEHRDLYSDTPQGALTGVENENYLTNARKITEENTQNHSNESTTKNTYNENETQNQNKKANITEQYNETIKGKQGVTSFSKMLVEYRESLLNIDQLVIEEFSDLFMSLW
nr:MAG TPA: Lower collar protein [Caudoviricetes sp.]